MKSLEETIKYIEMELKILSLEDLNVTDSDNIRDAAYKNTQIGKRIAYEKMLAFINNEHNVNSRHLRKAAKKNSEEVKDSKKPIIVCV